MVQLVPVDALRFGYRVWTERETGVVVKLQTLDAAQGVLEQAAFSELQLSEPVNMAKLAALMDNTEGYQVEKPELGQDDGGSGRLAVQRPGGGLQAHGLP